jgi:peptidoglycan hydrolase-like protein with peptidoglycan-binding domain
VLSYLSGWTAKLHRHKYLSGVYSSGSSGIRDLAAVHGSRTYQRPDHLWIAWWNERADTDGGDYVADALWADHQRVHQYTGPVTQSWGGRSINIDRNFLDVDTGPFGGAADPCPTRMSYPSYPLLRSGSEGRYVRAAECRLVRLGFERVRPGGPLGPSSIVALNRFKSSLGLAPDGVLGPRAWTALLSAGRTPQLEAGAQGRAVHRLQRSLTAALQRPVKTTGRLGAGTQRALRSYQAARDLRVTGVAGSATWRALQAGR